MGIMPGRSGTVSLTDTSSNLSVVLGQLTRGQLSSFDQIVTTDGQPLNLDLATLSRLDNAGANQHVSWASKRLNVIDSSDNVIPIVVTATAF